MSHDPATRTSDLAAPPSPATRKQYLSGLRYAHHKCCDAALLFESQAAARGLSLAGSEKLRRVATELMQARDVLRAALDAHHLNPLLRRHLSALPMRLWARATRLSGELFCLDMAAHMSRKLSLILANLASFADSERLPLEAARLNAASADLAATAAVLRPTASGSGRP